MSTKKLTSKPCWAYHNSCLVLTFVPPIFWPLHPDRWAWTRHWYPPKWWYYGWQHRTKVPVKTAKVGSVQIPGKPNRGTSRTKERKGLWLLENNRALVKSGEILCGLRRQKNIFRSFWDQTAWRRGQKRERVCDCWEKQSIGQKWGITVWLRRPKFFSDSWETTPREIEGKRA